LAKLLVVDDEPVICWTLREALFDEGHECLTASSAEEASAKADQFQFDLILMDVRLPGSDGISAIAGLKQKLGDIPVLIMTAFGDLQTAVKAVEKGASGYLIKPFDLEEACLAVQRALANTIKINQKQQRHLLETEPYQIIGRSREMQSLFHKIALLARRDAPVMITGESGTGKELIARAIHQNGPRKSKPFIATNMTAFNPGLMEKELFGHVKGAYTGADRDSSGLFQQAHGGTLFLDEIGEVPAEMQVKLLRVLENREVTPVGAAHSVPIDVRFIAATNRSLPDLIRQGIFREDFYFRLNVFPVHLPPLRERPEDIQELVNHFLISHQAEMTAEALLEIKKRKWPGNVRQLKNAVEHAAILAQHQQIQPEHLPPDIDIYSNQSNPDTLDRMIGQWVADQLKSTAEENLHEQFLARFEPILLRLVLEANKGQKQPSARMLGIHRATLRQMLRKYDLGDEN